MGVQKSSSVAHIFEGDTRPNCELKRAVSANLGTSQVGLEKRAHLGITWATVRQHQEVQIKRKHVDQDWDNNQPHNTSNQVFGEHSLFERIRVS
jgi:hypothetical protein